ncbi:MAG: DUF3566 domain-containing protein [Candidatus Zixiibacteriota bacterium]
MRYEIKSIPLWAFTKAAFFFNFILGFIFGFLYALFAGFILTFMSSFPMFQTDELPTDNLPFGMLLVIFPFLFAILGAFFQTLAGIIIVFIYNLIAKFVGGVELKLQPVDTDRHEGKTPPPIYAQTATAKTPASSLSPVTPPPPPPIVKPQASQEPSTDDHTPLQNNEHSENSEIENKGNNNNV